MADLSSGDFNRLTTELQLLNKELQSQRESLARQVFRGGVGAYATGTGMPFNPLNPFSALQFGVSSQTAYNSVLKSSQAFLGENFNASRVDAMAPSLTRTGFSRMDLAQYMQQVAQSARQATTELDQVTKAAMNFAKANGFDPGAVSGIVGNLSRNTNLMGGGAKAVNDAMEGIRQLAGRNNAAVIPMAVAVTQLQDQARAAGALPGEIQGGVSREMRLLAGFKELNPQLYGTSPEYAVSAANQIAGAGRGMLLAYAMDIAAQQGKSTDPADLMAAFERRETWLIGGMAERIGREKDTGSVLALTGGMTGSLIQDLRKDPEAVLRGSANFGLDGNQRSLLGNDQRAVEATSDQERKLAALMNASQASTGVFKSSVDKFSQAVTSFVSEYGMGGVVGAGAALGLGGMALKGAGKRVAAGLATRLGVGAGAGLLEGGGVGGALGVLGTVLGGVSAATVTGVVAAVGALGAAGYQGYKAYKELDAIKQGEEENKAANAAAIEQVREKARARASGAQPTRQQMIDFVNKWLPSANRAGAEIGVSGHVLLSQLALETAYGTKIIDGTNNVGNIKAGKNWRGDTVRAYDKTEKSYDPYRVYASEDEGMADYARLLKNRRFAQAHGAGDDALTYGHGMKAGNYATDKDYAEKIANIDRIIRPIADSLSNVARVAVQASTDSTVASFGRAGSTRGVRP